MLSQLKENICLSFCIVLLEYYIRGFNQKDRVLDKYLQQKESITEIFFFHMDDGRARQLNR